MLKQDILSKIDHTELRPNATYDDFVRLCDEAKRYGVATVCVPPNRVKFARSHVPGTVNVCTVVGFPLGYNTLETKVWEAKQAILDGANEIDMVIDIGRAADSVGTEWGRVTEEIRRLRRDICSGDIILKVIVETCYLNEKQKIKLCEIVSNLDVDFIKTSTGFGTGGATLEDVLLFRDHIGPRVKIKAAGGISTIADAKAFIEAGCARIGSSKLVRLLAEIEGDEV